MEYLKYVPKNLLSRAVGQLMEARHPSFLIKRARNAFAKYYNINISEAEKPLDEYRNISELFARRLKAGVRPIGDGIVHPCDAELTTVEVIENGSLVQAKGMQYSLDELVKEPGAASHFAGGMALTYYLCPTDYHRVHAPVAADISRVILVPGTLWPVNERSVKSVPQLFAVNERLVIHLQTPLGRVLLVMVGATNVGRMTLSFDPAISTNRTGRDRREVLNYNPPKKIAKGEELGAFHMGSTVIVLYPPKFLNVLPTKGRVLVGQSI